ncbi:MAG: rhomboid family intramembrane serine protease [Anaerolineaceae bacterium]|nr:MAG: rhomboid family intramembrane serine protease [Anaerolineaceae bacterium]
MEEILEVRKNPMSIIFLLASVAVFAIARTTDPENVRFLAFDSAELPHRWYAFVTYGFVHVDWNHIIVNMLILIWIGVWVERLIGSRKYTLLVLIAIVAGGLSLFVRDTAGIGFSAAAAAIIFHYHFAFPWKKELPFRIPNIVLPVVLLVLSVAAIIFGWLPSVGHYPHIAGALVGLGFLYVFRKSHNPIDDDTEEGGSVADSHPLDIYKAQDAGHFFSPFNLKCDPMERLLLINFENDPDTVYVGFEPQMFDDPIKGCGLLVIAWRHDGMIDVYHQPTLNLKREEYDIVGKGLCDFIIHPFDGGHFAINERGVDLSLTFEDKTGRPITLYIHEHNSKRRKPFGLLAPFPSETEKPPSLPLALLYDFYFVRRGQTDVEVTIDGKKHQLDLLPAPIDSSRMYFMRYASDPFIVLWNQNHEGALLSLPIDDDVAIDADAIYEISENGGQPEISVMQARSDRHDVRFLFNPSFPNVVNLRDGVQVGGNFTIDLEKTMGRIEGHYHIQRTGDDVEIEICPTGGWQPHLSKLSLRFMFTVVSVFKEWPKSYQWRATIDVSDPAVPAMRSRWRRLT